MEIRPLESWEEYRTAEELQRRVWGEDFSELAPASLMKIGRRLGGVASGAFREPDRGDAEPDAGPGALPAADRLVGFVYGLTGLEGERPVHWSHMLAVLEEHRDAGLGRRLKEHQRELLLERGVERMYWTYDPLVSRNAHFNLNRLGAEVVEYVEDMYGDTGSRLHEGLGTDRFVVAWDLTAYRPGGAAAAGDAAGEPGRGAGADASHLETAEVEVPLDIHAVRRDDPAAAADWRRDTRRAFIGKLGAGFRVVGFEADTGEGVGRYLLARG